MTTPHIPYISVKRARRPVPAAVVRRHQQAAADADYGDHDRAGVPVVNLEHPPAIVRAYVDADATLICLDCIRLGELPGVVQVCPEASDVCDRCGRTVGEAAGTRP